MCYVCVLCVVNIMLFSDIRLILENVHKALSWTFLCAMFTLNLQAFART